MNVYIALLAGVPWRYVASRIAAALLALTMIGTTSCTAGGENPTGPGDEHEGFYELSRIDLEPPPVVIHQGPWYDPADGGTFYNRYVVEITGGEISLDDDGRFTMEFSVAIDGDGETFTRHVAFEGTYEIIGDRIEFTTDDGGGGFAGISGNEIVMPMDPMGKGVTKNYVFER